MKKVFGIILGLLLGTSCCFAESIWHFKSGDSKIGCEHFFNAEVRNYSGWRITANGRTIFSGSKQTIYGSDIFIVSDAVGRPEAYYTKENGNFVIIIQE